MTPTPVPLIGLDGVVEVDPRDVVIPASEYAVSVIVSPLVTTLIAAGSDATA
jgi:hypothetical protein